MRLTVPDKRYCFDFRRPLTAFSDIVGRHAMKLKKPRSQDVYAHHQLVNPGIKNATFLWGVEAGTETVEHWSYSNSVHITALHAARAANNNYLDVHMSQWTSETFFQHLKMMNEFALHPELRVTRIQYTMKNDLQFYVVLKKFT